VASASTRDIFPSQPKRGQFPWYAVHVKSRFEREVSEALRQKGYEEFAAFYRTRRRWSDRTKTVEFPLFPGYIFCRFDGAGPLRCGRVRRSRRGWAAASGP